MKKIILITILIFAINLFPHSAKAEITQNDYKEVIKTTKILKKLSDKNKINEIGKYFSEDYLSFDGFDKKQMLNIYDIASKMYPNSKTKETIKKIETKDNCVKVYIDETSITNLNVEGEDAKYAAKDKIKGKMITKGSYAMYYKKENDGIWRVVKDEIFDEITDIRYGEAIKTEFEMENPEVIQKGEEFTVKTKITADEDRFVIGSIGHDKIMFPPEKYLDPYRAIDKTGILERVMIANNEGKNEYINSTFALVVTKSGKDNKKVYNKTAISGMGIYIKRVNLKENQPLL